MKLEVLNVLQSYASYVINVLQSYASYVINVLQSYAPYVINVLQSYAPSVMGDGIMELRSLGDWGWDYRREYRFIKITSHLNWIATG